MRQSVEGCKCLRLVKRWQRERVIPCSAYTSLRLPPKTMVQRKRYPWRTRHKMILLTRFFLLSLLPIVIFWCFRFCAARGTYSARVGKNYSIIPRSIGFYCHGLLWHNTNDGENHSKSNVSYDAFISPCGWQELVLARSLPTVWRNGDRHFAQGRTVSRTCQKVYNLNIWIENVRLLKARVLYLALSSNQTILISLGTGRRTGLSRTCLPLFHVQCFWPRTNRKLENTISGGTWKTCS